MTNQLTTVLRLAICGAALMSTAACATVVRGTKEEYRVESTPPSATVRTSHGFTCTTPCTMKLPRKSEFDITVSLTGHKPFEQRVTNHISGEGAVGLVGNVLIGGVIGVGVDAVSGASLDLRPNPLIVVLAEEGSDEESRTVEPMEAPGGQ